MIITSNKKAYHDFHILEKFEAGMELQGSEVKSLRAGKANLLGAHVLIENNQAILYNSDIAAYDMATCKPHEPKRPRKLLLHKKEILKLHDETRIEGKTIVVLDLHWKNGKAKATIATAKGKTNHDKRQTLKEKASKREIQQSLRTNQKR